jgi:hypothetical protein
MSYSHIISDIGNNEWRTLARAKALAAVSFSASGLREIYEPMHNWQDWGGLFGTGTPIFPHVDGTGAITTGNFQTVSETKVNPWQINPILGDTAGNHSTPIAWHNDKWYVATRFKYVTWSYVGAGSPVSYFGTSAPRALDLGGGYVFIRLKLFGNNAGPTAGSIFYFGYYDGTANQTSTGKTFQANVWTDLEMWCDGTTITGRITDNTGSYTNTICTVSQLDAGWDDNGGHRLWFYLSTYTDGGNTLSVTGLSYDKFYALVQSQTVT